MKCLDKLEKALLKVTDDVYHYEALKKTNHYIVWSEDGSGKDLSANNRKQIQVIQGTIDLYTQMEDDPYIDQIQKELNEAGISWSLNSVQYDDDTKYIHYEWVFEVS